MARNKLSWTNARAEVGEFCLRSTCGRFEISMTDEDKFRLFDAVNMVTISTSEKVVDAKKDAAVYKVPQKTTPKITYWDLRIGMKFRAEGEGKKIYKIIGLDNKKKIITTKRLKDGVVYDWAAERFVPLIQKAELIK